MSVDHSRKATVRCLLVKSVVHSRQQKSCWRRNLTVYRRSFFAHPLCASLSCLQYGISFGNKKPDNVDGDYIVLLSNLIEEGTVQCIVE